MIRELQRRLLQPRHSVRQAMSYLLPLAILLLSFVFATSAHAQNPTVSINEVEQAIAQNLVRVPEFVFIRAEAEKLGVRAYLFGGTAAGYAHYVRNDLLRAKGDQTIQAARFDYDFTNIFRSTQDLDVVIDGPPEKIELLNQILKAKFPHFIGGKDVKWELRSLRESKGKAGEPGYKEALLDSADFLNQNSDSNSTGLIEVTQSKNGEVVLDLRDRNSRPSQFLKDVTNGEISFYLSAQHNSTPRAQAGNNPEVFSVVRALTKAFQYDLKIRDQDRAKMRGIVANFQADEIAKNGDNRRRLIDMGKKLFLHAVDVERAWNDTEAMGLRQKLLEFDNGQQQDSLAWWMSKEPLRTKPVGQGNGETAAEVAKRLGMSELMIAHETRSFLALESIERSVKGVPNFFISRNGHPGEGAAYGDGTYARIGRSGAVGSGLTVRMVLDPRSRVGSDFLLAAHDYIVLLNKAAARVSNESYTLTLPQYVEMIANDEEFDRNEKGLLEKMTRRLRNQAKATKPEEQTKIREIYRNAKFKFRVLSELNRLGAPLPVSRGEFDRIVAEQSERVRGLKESYRRRAFGAGVDYEDAKPVVEAMSDLALLATTVDQFDAALRNPFNMKRWQGMANISIAPFVNAQKRLAGEHYDRMLEAIKTYEDFATVRRILEGSMYTGRFKEFAAPRMKSAADLLALQAPQGNELGGSTHIKWIDQNPELVMKLKPTLEELTALQNKIGVNDVAGWAERAVVYAKTPAEIIVIMNPKVGYPRADHEYIAPLMPIWEKLAPRFLALNPTGEDIALVLQRMNTPRLEVLLTPTTARRAVMSCEAAFM